MPVRDRSRFLGAGPARYGHAGHRPLAQAHVPAPRVLRGWPFSLDSWLVLIVAIHMSSKGEHKASPLLWTSAPGESSGCCDISRASTRHRPYYGRAHMVSHLVVAIACLFRYSSYEF